MSNQNQKQRHACILVTRERAGVRFTVYSDTWDPLLRSVAFPEDARLRQAVEDLQTGRFRCVKGRDGRTQYRFHVVDAAQDTLGHGGPWLTAGERDAALRSLGRLAGTALVVSDPR